MTDHHPSHAHRLAEDLQRIDTLMARRRALKWVAGAGTVAFLAGCGGSDAESADTTTTGTATPTPTVTPTPTPTPTGTTATGTCIADPQETGGPYPADGTNTSSGSTSNVLTASGIVRSDIRASFLTTTTVATGVAVTFTITVVNVNATCAPLAGYAVYLWHCDRSGTYSLYGSGAGESYLRGVQVTDANGQATFTTIFPGCYDGRWPHIHFEVFSTLSNALGGRYAILTSQFALPAGACSTVYTDTTTYPASRTNFARVALSSDNVFGDNTTAQLAQMTPTFTGDPSTGYTATAVIGVAR
ncbi:intradiol ring-cleavage dioxygenase [Sphingomonas endophytica]|jgi:protocatechuate 3,4-dioxygenase beta subunit|uniref:Protocatechuate 3,4-dioxygenase beta subunit n=1 Tax=Sphingomonas endophytica TaxID=869719 RepID=A0A7X0JGE3_9SPHN|nr:intradiol ring-cleavage dioxygenase [Sphingomonas endophytica]MBB5726219.1 protocatechuate 3,4-dioxygenase beta subunit [Sphingomonas endophytica]MBB6506232.1 protocatechuate 3,4-dioxygenase beta subunit [Sphingomonas endophytica]